MELVLASASARRRELLTQIGVTFTVEPADIDESTRPGEGPEDYVLRMAREKAAVIAGANPNGAVLGADTSVITGATILGKPEDRDHARRMLSSLSGASHRVVSGIALQAPGFSEAQVVSTEVRFAALSSEVIEAYLDTEEPWDKAGAYAIQGLAGAFVAGISGSYSNVVGLPLHETWLLLSKLGIANALSAPDAG